MRILSWKHTAYALLAPVILAGAAARAQQADVVQFREQLTSVFDRLLAMNDLMAKTKRWDSEGDLRLKLEAKDLTNSYILSVMNQAVPPAAARLEDDLNESFAQATGYMSVEQLRKYWGSHGHFATVLAAPCQGQDALVVGYWLAHGNTSLDVIEVAVRVSGVYQFVAEGGHEMADHELRLTLMPSGSPEAIWFLASGLKLGANQSPISVALYRFDGSSLAATWSRSQLWQGSVNTQGNRIILTHRDDAHWAENTPPYILREEYELTSGGIKLASKQWADSE